MLMLSGRVIRPLGCSEYGSAPAQFYLFSAANLNLSRIISKQLVPEKGVQFHPTLFPSSLSQKTAGVALQGSTSWWNLCGALVIPMDVRRRFLAVRVWSLAPPTTLKNVGTTSLWEFRLSIFLRAAFLTPHFFFVYSHRWCVDHVALIMATAAAAAVGWRVC